MTMISTLWFLRNCDYIDDSYDEDDENGNDEHDDDSDDTNTEYTDDDDHDNTHSIHAYEHACIYDVVESRCI